VTPRLLASVALAAALALPAAALAQSYRFPFGGSCSASSCYVTAYFDLDSSGGIQDWNCGSNTYNGHRGTDFGVGSWAGMDAGRDIVAAAEGDVISSHDGEFDRCSSGDCAGGGGYGNWVRLQHADGKTTTYGHMKNGTVAVSVGDHVACGQRLGQVGSSGYSTGPHLHFEVRTSGGTADDPFTGPCGGPVTYWIDQGAYDGLPRADCPSAPPPDADGDGYAADVDCNDGNADIHPGAAESCNGVDDNCDGATDEGVLNRCGACGPEPTEICDGIDNDCDGTTDEDCSAEGNDATDTADAGEDGRPPADASRDGLSLDVPRYDASGTGVDGGGDGGGCGCAVASRSALSTLPALLLVAGYLVRRRRRG
jgi:MYXO-CTERM domain-containing protein